MKGTTKYQNGFSLGRAINILKASKELESKDIANQMFKSEVTISRWISGEQTPSFADVVNLCDLNGVPFSTFAQWGEL